MNSWEFYLGFFLGTVVSLLVREILEKYDREKALFAKVQDAKTSDEVRKIIMQGKLNRQHYDEAWEKLTLLCDQERISELTPKLAEAKTYAGVKAVFQALPNGELRDKASKLMDKLFWEELRAKLDNATTSREAFEVYKHATIINKHDHLTLEAELKYKDLLIKEIAECISPKELKYIILDEEKEFFFDQAVCRYAELLNRHKKKS